MTTCYSCSKSFAVPDEYGGFALLCRPDGDDGRVQSAEIPCLRYQREPGADEPEEKL